MVVEKKQAQGHIDLPRFRPTGRLTALLLHVWTDIIIMVESYKGVLHVNPAGYRPEVEDEQILPWGYHLSFYSKP